MKKIILSFAALATFSMVGMMFFNDGNLYSNTTGAPVRTTCAQSGCHNDGGDAQTSTDVFLTVKDSVGTEVTEYVSGQKYTVTAGKHNATARVGFALSANIGTMAKVAGDSKVQKINSSGGYLTHTFAGTATTAGEASWTGTWTAPSTGAATITVFVNETNSNNAVTGDHIYTATTTLSHNTTGLNTLSSDIQFKVFPNPSADRLFIALNVKYASPLSVSLTSIDGKQTTSLMNEEIAKGKIERSFDISGLAKGIYFMTIQTTEGTATQKVLVN
jgi:hypothetical protein